MSHFYERTRSGLDWSIYDVMFRAIPAEKRNGQIKSALSRLRQTALRLIDSHVRPQRPRGWRARFESAWNDSRLEATLRDVADGRAREGEVARSVESIASGLGSLLRPCAHDCELHDSPLAIA